MNQLNPTVVVSFMGVDGTGKTTLIKKLSKKLSNKYKKIKYLHLRPYLFLLDKSLINSNPHKHKQPHSMFVSLIKILIWLFIYKFFFFINLKKKNQLIIFDRYVHDLLIDKIRYRFNLNNSLTKYILNLFPEPHLWLFLKAPIEIIEKRKKELSTRELKKQMKAYMSFAKTKKNSLLIDTNKNTAENLSLITKKINSIIL